MVDLSKTPTTLQQETELPERYAATELYTKCLELIVQINKKLPRGLPAEEKEFFKQYRNRQLLNAQGNINKLQDLESALTSILAQLKEKKPLTSFDEPARLFHRCGMWLRIMEDYRLHPTEDTEMDQFISEIKQELQYIGDVNRLKGVENRLSSLHQTYLDSDIKSKLKRLDTAQKSNHGSLSLRQQIQAYYSDLRNLSVEQRVAATQQGRLNEILNRIEYEQCKKDCIALLHQIYDKRVIGEGKKDLKMEQYFGAQREKIIKAQDLAAMLKIKNTLQAVYTSLAASDVVKATIANFRRRANEERLTIGMRKKANRIEDALRNVPVEQRGSIKEAVSTDGLRAHENNYSPEVLQVVAEIKRFRTLFHPKETRSFGDIKRAMQQINATGRKEPDSDEPSIDPRRRL